MSTDKARIICHILKNSVQIPKDTTLTKNPYPALSTKSVRTNLTVRGGFLFFTVIIYRLEVFSEIRYNNLNKFQRLKK